MKKVFSFIGIIVGTQFIVSLPAIADAPDTLWTKTYGGTDDDCGYSVQECADGGFIIAGTTESFGAGSEDVYLIRTKADGDTLWTKTYGGINEDYGHSVQECANGDFIIVGYTHSFGAGEMDVYLIRTNSDGIPLWTKTYGGTDWDEGSSVQECASGGFIIAGATASYGAGSYDVYLIRTNADGTPLWIKTYGGTDYDRGESVQECASEGFIIAGYTESFGAGGDVYLIRTNADGAPLWTKTYGGWGYSVQQCADGGFIIAGSSAGDVYLIRISETGVEESELRVESLELRVFPNPSFGNALIKYGLPEKASISLRLYDISGRIVKTIYSGTQEKGYYKVDIKQDEMKGGIYFIRFETNKFKATKKLTILR